LSTSKQNQEKCPERSFIAEEHLATAPGKKRQEGGDAKRGHLGGEKNGKGPFSWKKVNLFMCREKGEKEKMWGGERSGSRETKTQKRKFSSGGGAAMKLLADDGRGGFFSIDPWGGGRGLDRKKTLWHIRHVKEKVDVEIRRGTAPNNISRREGHFKERKKQNHSASGLSAGNRAGGVKGNLKPRAQSSCNREKAGVTGQPNR